MFGTESCKIASENEAAKFSLAGREYIGGENLLQAKNIKRLEAAVSL
jgi:hypothetical protein